MSDLVERLKRRADVDSLNAAARIEQLEQLDREAATHVESLICMRTDFTGEPPYVGWKGLGLALTEKMDSLEAALADSEARNEWHPIETAPRDGTVVLLRLSFNSLCRYAKKHWPRKQLAVGYFDRLWVYGVPGGHAEGGSDNQFTHWKSLSEPPAPFEEEPKP